MTLDTASPQLRAALEQLRRLTQEQLKVLGEIFPELGDQALARHQLVLDISTPILQIRQGLCVIPIIGLIDSRRARQLTDTLLYTIRERRTRVVILDVTGVSVMDTEVASRLLQTVQAARLLGAEAIMTGISPAVALTIVSLGLELEGVQTKGDLESGLEEAEKILRRWEPHPPAALAAPPETAVASLGSPEILAPLPDGGQ